MKETKHTRIAIAGIGGIGGYIGGKLAHYYLNDESVEVIFIARGETTAAIDQQGLQLLSKSILYHCKPALTSDDAVAIGIIDVLIICTKNFSVAGIIEKYASCLANGSIVITTQNTVNGCKAISRYLPSGVKLMEGCIYIASNIVAPGKVEHIGGPAKLIFGSSGQRDGKGEAIAHVLNKAGIDAMYTTDIDLVLWKKFMFVSPVAIVTALFRITFAEIRINQTSEQLFIDLTSELMTLAIAKNIPVDADTVANNLNLLASFKGNVKSSFQLDLEQGKPTEVDSLVKYVVDEAKIYQIPTPWFDTALVQLSEQYQLLSGTY